MGLNLMLLCVGLIICFGGIHFRKFVSGLMGLIWGAFLGLIIVVVVALASDGLWYLRSNLEEATTLIVVILFAVAFCALSAWLDKLCAALNAFTGSFVMYFIIACMLVEDFDSISVVLLVLVILSAITSAIAYAHHNYSYIFVTAFSGALIASVGGYGLLTNNELSDVLYELILYGGAEVILPVIIGTIILGCIGCYVQVHRFKTVHPHKARGASVGTDAKSSFLNNADFSLITSTTKAVADEALKAGQNAGRAAAPVLKDMWAQLKSAWSELKTERGKQDLRAEVLACKHLFVPIIASSLIIPSISLIVRWVFGDNQYAIISFLSRVAEAMSLGILTYFVIAKDTKMNMAYQVPKLVGRILFYFRSFRYFCNIAISFKYIFLWAILFFISKFIKKDSVKPLLLSIIAYFMSQYVLEKIIIGFVGFRLNLYTILGILITIGTAYYAVYKDQKDNCRKTA